MKALEINDCLTVCGKKYIVREVCSKSSERKVYKVRGEQEVTYIIKELLSASPTVRDHLCRDEYGLAVLDTERCKKEGIDPQKLLDSVGGLGGEEQQSNTAVIYDETADNNSNYFFQTEMLAQTDAAAYFLVNTEAGDPLDRLRQRWVKELSGDALLLAVTKLMIETAKALEYMHSSKHVLHLDIKPQNIYALGNEHDRRIKLLDLGSALSLKILEDDDNCRFCIESTDKYQSPLLMRISSLIMPDCDEDEEELFGIERDSELLRNLIRELSVRDDILALSKVMACMLTGDPDAKMIMISGCNRYCLKLLNDILTTASQGNYFTVCGETFKNGIYDNISLMRQDLEELKNALLGAGISKTLFLKKGENYIRQKTSEKGAYVNGQYRIDDALIPAVRRKSEDDDSDGKPIVDFKELLGSEKKNLFIASEGGAGKTFLLWKIYLDYIERREIIPIFIPLNEMASSEDFLLYFIANKYTGYEYEDKASKVFSYFEYHTDQRFLILADGLNEIPTTKPQNKRNAVNNLLKLSKLPNVSMVVTSRRENIEFSSFEHYELSKLDECILKEKLSDYDNLSSELRQLLITPFNLSLYLRLPKEYKDKAIKTSTDIIQANVDRLCEKLTDQGIPKDTTEYIFDYLLPILSLQQSKKNLMNFSYSEVSDTLDLCSLMLKRTIRFAQPRSEIAADTDLFISKVTELLADNSVIFVTEEYGRNEVYTYFHENIRDFFASKGWLQTVKNFRMFYERDKESLAADTFQAPVCVHGYLKQLIEKEDKAILQNMAEQNKKSNEGEKRIAHCWFEYLFNITTRGMIRSNAAAEFNSIIINLIKLLFEHEKDGIAVSYFHHDFSCLDLSLSDFCGTVLDHCDFSGSYMYYRPFGIGCFPRSPDRIWNNSEKVIVLYRIGYIRTTFFNDAVRKDREVDPFEVCAVDNERILLFRNCRPRNSINNRGYITVCEISEYNADTLDLIRVNELSVPKSALEARTLRGVLKKHLPWELKIFRAFKLKGKFILVITPVGLFCFEISGYRLVFSQLNKTYHFYDQSEHHFNIPVENGFFNDKIEVFRNASESDYTVLFDTACSADRIDSTAALGRFGKFWFIVLKTDPEDNQTPLRCFGPFSNELFKEYDRVVDIFSKDTGVYAVVEKESELITLEICLETGTVKQTELSFDKNHCYISRVLQTKNRNYDKDLSGLNNSQYSRRISFVDINDTQARHYEINYQCRLYDSILSIYDNTFCLFDDSKLSVGRIDCDSQKEEFFNPVLTFSFYSHFAKPLYQFDKQTISILSPNSFGCYYDIINHRFVTEPKSQGGMQIRRRRVPPKYLDYYFLHKKTDEYDSKGDEPFDSKDGLYNMPEGFLLYKGSWNPLDDSDFPQASKRYLLREKLKAALKGMHETLYVCNMGLVHERYLFVSAIQKNSEAASFKTYDCLVDTFLILNLDTNRLSRIDNPYPYIASDVFGIADDFIFAVTDNLPAADRIDNVYLITENRIIEMSFDLRHNRASVTHVSELFPFTRLIGCNFADVDLKISPAAFAQVNEPAMDHERIKQSILRTWKENNLTDE